MHFAAEASILTVLASRLTCFLDKTYTVDYKIQQTLSRTTRLLKALTAFLRGRNKLVSNVITKQTRCSAISERPRCRVCYSFRQKQKTGNGRQYFRDIIGLINHCDVGVGILMCRSWDKSQSREKMLEIPNFCFSTLQPIFTYFYSFGGQQNFLLTQYYALTDKIICQHYVFRPIFQYFVSFVPISIKLGCITDWLVLSRFRSYIQVLFAYSPIIFNFCADPSPSPGYIKYLHTVALAVYKVAEQVSQCVWQLRAGRSCVRSSVLLEF